MTLLSCFYYSKNRKPVQQMCKESCLLLFMTLVSVSFLGSVIVSTCLQLLDLSGNSMTCCS